MCLSITERKRESWAHKKPDYAELILLLKVFIFLISRTNKCLEELLGLEVSIEEGSDHSQEGQSHQITGLLESPC